MSKDGKNRSINGWRRVTFILSLISGATAVCIIPPPLYFQFDRFTAGLPQQYLGFDPNRFIAGIPQRTVIELGLIWMAKFFFGITIVWLIYAIIRFISRGFMSKEK